MASNAFDRLKKVQQIRKREVFLPISKITCLCSPLSVGDDLTLKTMVASPDIYDHELLSLLYKKTEFPEVDRPTFNQFLDNIADFDRNILLYGLFTASYNNFGKHEIKCPSCEHTWEEKIMCEDVLHADLVTLWDKEEKFLDYRLKIDIDIENDEHLATNYIFNAKIPSMRDHMKALKMISNEKLKDNFEKFGTLLSRNDDLAMITDSIEIGYIDDENEKRYDTINKDNEIYQAISNYIGFDILDQVIDKYTVEIDKYRPKFKKYFTCFNCGHEFEFDINIEISLFKKFFRIDDDEK